MTGLAVPWSFDRLVFRQSGDLFLPLPKDTVITSELGKRKWILQENTTRVMGPDRIFTSLFKIDDVAYVLTRVKKSFALLPVDKDDAKRIVGAVLEPFKSALVFLPGNFDYPIDKPFPASHRNLIRMIWANVPDEFRRDLEAEDSERRRLLELPHVQAPMLLWLLGCLALEKCLKTMAIVSPTGMAGQVECLQVEQFIDGRVRKLHVVLKGAAPTSSQVRVCLPYAPGNATFEAKGFEYRENGGSKGSACPLTSPLSIFSSEPASFASSRLIFALPSISNTAVSVSDSEENLLPFRAGESDNTKIMSLLQEDGMMDSTVFKHICDHYPTDDRKEMINLIGDADVAKVMHNFAQGLTTALLSTDFIGYKVLFDEILSRWCKQSKFSRIANVLLMGNAEANQSLEGVLLRSFRMFAQLFCRHAIVMSEGIEAVATKEIIRLVGILSPIRTQ